MLFQMLPNSNIEYKDPKYWNTRFSKEDSYEWLVGYKHVQDTIINNYMKNSSKSCKILQLGCGNSSFASDLYNDGFHDITNIDISSVCVEKMSSKYPHLKFLTMDMTAMSEELSDNSFDVVLEKATLDALVVDCTNPWDFTCSSYSSIKRSLKEIKKVLKPSGLFISITFTQPHFR